MNPSTESLDINEIKARISEMLAALSTVYRVEIEQKTYRAYAPMLCDIPLEVLEVALEQCGAELKFFPSVAEIRDRALALSSRTEITGMEAWAIVLKALQKYGPYKMRPPFDDPLIEDSIKFFGGWWELCNSDNVTADRA